MVERCICCSGEKGRERERKGYNAKTAGTVSFMILYENGYFYIQYLLLVEVVSTAARVAFVTELLAFSSMGTDIISMTIPLLSEKYQ